MTKRIKRTEDQLMPTHKALVTLVKELDIFSILVINGEVHIAYNDLKATRLEVILNEQGTTP